MEKKVSIETVGHIYKVETLCSISSNILPNSLVLENKEAFPGYHGENVPKELAPFHIFLITKKKHTPEKIIRTSANIKKYFNSKFNATYAEVCFLNQVYSSIRLKDLESFEIIPDLQNCYIDEGIKFRQKKNIETSSIIKIFKSFLLEEIEEGIYEDQIDPQLSYLKIPEKLKWKQFEIITRSIKNNIDNSNFDAAYGVIFFKEITDVVRIYAKDSNPKRLSEIRTKYIESIKKFHQ